MVYRSEEAEGSEERGSGIQSIEGRGYSWKKGQGNVREVGFGLYVHS